MGIQWLTKRIGIALSRSFVIKCTTSNVKKKKKGPFQLCSLITQNVLGGMMFYYKLNLTKEKVVMGWALNDQTRADPEPWKSSSSWARALTGLYFLLNKNSNFLGHSQKVGAKPRSSLGPSHNFEPKPGLGSDPSLGKIISSKQHLQGKNYIQLLITWPWSSVAIGSKFYWLFW